MNRLKNNSGDTNPLRRLTVFRPREEKAVADFFNEKETTDPGATLRKIKALSETAQMITDLVLLEKTLRNALCDSDRAVRARAGVLTMEKSSELRGEAHSVLYNALHAETDPQVATLMLKAYETSVRSELARSSAKVHCTTIYSATKGMLSGLSQMTARFEQGDGRIMFENALFDAVINSFYPKTSTDPRGIQEILRFSLESADERQLLKCIYLLGILNVENPDKPLGGQIDQNEVKLRSEAILEIVSAKGDNGKVRDTAEASLSNLRKPVGYEADRRNLLAREVSQLELKIY